MGKGKINIVLDLDETCLYTHPEDFEDEDEEDEEEKDFEGNASVKYKELGLFTTRKGRKLRDKVYVIQIDNIYGNCVGDYDKLYGVFRPYFREFLQFLSEDEGIGHIIIWTAGTRKYGDYICKLLFSDIEKHPSIVFTRGSNEGEQKPLDKIYEEARSMGIHDINKANTLALDDKSSTFRYNVSNGIKIPKFKCDLTHEDITNHEDDNLLKLMLWLQTKEVRECKDVRKLNKKRIFNTSVEEYKQILEEEKEESE